MKRAHLAVLTIPLIVAGCVWIKPTPQGETVRVVSVAEPSCQQVGKATVFEKTKFGPYERKPATVKAELLNLARKTAADDFGGDTIVPLTEIKDGQQTFAVYKCVS